MQSHNLVRNSPCNERFSKHIYGDTTVAGDTFIIEKNDDTHDGIISILTSTETKDLSEIHWTFGA